MARRAVSMAFAAGAVVFPGGAVDEADRALALASGSGTQEQMDDLAARIAAIRETIEECGLAIAASAPVGPDLVRTLRSGLDEGRGLADLIEKHGLSFDYDALAPFARWCPQVGGAKKRYDTRFYIAVAGDGHDQAIADGSETTELGWHTAQEMLERADRDEVKIIFPTRRNLERLAQFGTLDELLHHTQNQPVATISPWVEERNGEKHLCIPEDAGYPVTSEILSSAMRG